jgi:hypothetical protein
MIQDPWALSFRFLNLLLSDTGKLGYLPQDAEEFIDLSWDSWRTSLASVQTSQKGSHVLWCMALRLEFRGVTLLRGEDSLYLYSIHKGLSDEIGIGCNVC